MLNEALANEPEKVDEVQLFMLFTLFGGDCRRVSAVTRVSVRTIEALAHDFNWKGKIAGRQRLDTDEGQEHERVLNRVSSYVTAERLSRVFSNLVASLDSDPLAARAFCTAVGDNGEVSFSVKNLTELAKGLQTVNDIKYRALGDKQAQNADTSTGTKSSAEFSLTVYKTLVNRFDQTVSVDTAAEIVQAVKDSAARIEDDTASEKDV